LKPVAGRSGLFFPSIEAERPLSGLGLARHEASREAHSAASAIADSERCRGHDLGVDARMLGA
jgi:hypothetical protein